MERKGYDLYPQKEISRCSWNIAVDLNIAKKEKILFSETVNYYEIAEWKVYKITSMTQNAVGDKYVLSLAQNVHNFSKKMMSESITYPLRQPIKS